MKTFEVHEQKTTEEILESIECSPKELCRRQKCISKGKLSKSYQSYTKLVPRKEREREHPRTPCKYKKLSRRSFDTLMRRWRLALHDYDTKPIDENDDQTKNSPSVGTQSSDNVSPSPSSSQRSDGCWSTQSSSSLSTTDEFSSIDENFLPDLYDFEESLITAGTASDAQLPSRTISDKEDQEQSTVNDINDDQSELVFGQVVDDLETADSMDTIMNSMNVDSRSAMTLE